MMNSTMQYFDRIPDRLLRGPFFHLLIFCFSLCCLVSPSLASETGEEKQALYQSIQSIKRDILKLNRNLFILEEDLLYPGSTQLTVFLSLDEGRFFIPDSAKITLNNKIVDSHLYTASEIRALKKGAVQRLYSGNIKNGKHQLTVVLTGIGANQRYLKRATTLEFEKQPETKYLNLTIRDNPKTQQADFLLEEWQD